MQVRLKPLDDQVIVITGATSGIGLCTAFNAALEDAKLVLVARGEDVLSELAEEINGIGGKAIAVAADVADLDQVKNVAQRAIERYGRIDTWINDAGVSFYGKLDEASEADCRRVFETNFWGTVNGSLVALPYLKQSGGALINLGSELSDQVIPLQGMYCASKHAVKGFTDALRVEVQEIDQAPVSITLIQPTAVNTPFPQHAKNYMDKEPKLPSPMIDPQQVAEAILHAATQGGRDVRVGLLAVADTAVSGLFPRLGDQVAALQLNRQQEEGPPVNPEGALYQPGHSGSIRGHAP